MLEFRFSQTKFIYKSVLDIAVLTTFTWEVTIAKKKFSWPLNSLGVWALTLSAVKILV